MSGPRRHKGLLKTTAALSAAGAVAVAPILPGVPALAQEASGGGPLDVRIGANAEFTRVEFSGAVGGRAQVRRDGKTVIIRVGSTAAPDVSRLKVDPPPGVESVETRAVRGGSEVVLTLAEGGEARSGSADGAVWINLYAPGAAPEAPQTPTATTTQAAATVPVAARATASSLDLTFAWPSPVGAAVFRRGQAVWVVFDTAGRMDMAGAKALGPATDVRWAAGQDYVAVRIAAPEGLGVSARAEGGLWTVSLSPTVASGGGVTLARDDAAGPTALVAQMAGATKTIWLTDPMLGDRFAAVTALAPAKGFGARRRMVDLTFLPSAQGLGVETAADDLSVEAQGDLVRISRPGGLSLSAPSAGLLTAADGHGAPRKALFPGLILSDWSSTGEAKFLSRRRELQSAAAEEAQAAADNPKAPIEARLAFARFLIASDLNYEAIGVLNEIAASAPGMLGEAEVRGLRGAARTMVGRLDEAAADFSAAVIHDDPSAQAWQGYIAVQKSDFAGARQHFAASAKAIDMFPPAWRARFATAHARAAIETGDLVAAKSLLDYAFAQDASPADQLAGRLVQARLFELDGQVDRALAVYKAVARAPLDGIAAPALLGVTRLEFAKGAIKPDEAAAKLEPLRWRWRGDATELQVMRTLGDIYLSQGRYREALDVLRGAGKKLPDLPESVELQTDLSNAFRALFLEGGADGMQPIQALALFYDFRDLTPVGADGDDMVRRLARRLIDVDLLDPAAELLKHQVDNRLEGVAKAQVATDLASVYLMDRQPEAALNAIWGSRTTLLPSALNAERRALEARALMELGRFDHALEVLAADRSGEADAVRAEVYWKQKGWAQAGAAYERLLGERWRAGGALTPEDESRLIRAGVGYSLAHDAGALARLSQRYGAYVPGAKQSAALRLALDAPGTVDASNIAAAAAGADTFAGWVTAAKTAFRNKTGAKASSAPAPASRPAPAA